MIAVELCGTCLTINLGLAVLDMEMGSFHFQRFLLFSFGEKGQRLIVILEIPLLFSV